jgi:hypothetical protein
LGYSNTCAMQYVPDERYADIKMLQKVSADLLVVPSPGNSQSILKEETCDGLDDANLDPDQPVDFSWVALDDRTLLAFYERLPPSFPSSSTRNWKTPCLMRCHCTRWACPRYSGVSPCCSSLSSRYLNFPLGYDARPDFPTNPDTLYQCQLCGIWRTSARKLQIHQELNHPEANIARNDLGTNVSIQTT